MRALATLGQGTTVQAETGKKWCSECGAVPASGVAPEIKTIFGHQPMYELPCSKQGCNGLVKMTRADLVALQHAGILVDAVIDVQTMRKLQEVGMGIANDPEQDPVDRVAGGRLALAVARDRMRMAGLMPEASGRGPAVTVNAAGAVTIEAGDSLDRRLDEMFNEQGGGVVDAEVVSRGNPSPGDGPPTVDGPTPSAVPAVDQESEEDGDDGAWV